MKREMQKIVKTLRTQGWVCTLTKNCHWRLVAPSGAVIFTGSTPSDHRTIKNCRAQLRRAGADL